jgi:hypothetical protein
MSGFVDLLRTEIARLERQLMHARALLNVYEEPVAAASGKQPKSNGAGRHRPFQPKGEDSKEHKVGAALHEVLIQLGGSAHRTAILAHLVSLGLMGHEKDPLKALGVYLHRFQKRDEVFSQGHGVWGLHEAPNQGFAAGSEEPTATRSGA